MKNHRPIILVGIVVLLLSGMTHAAQEETKQPESERKQHSRNVIYPILIQAPIFGASLDLPSIPGGGEISASTFLKLNAAYMGGISIEREKWFVDFAGAFASVSAKRDVTPDVDVGTDLLYFDTTGGWKFYNDFAVTGGVKRLALDIHATLPNDLTLHTKPGIWDPMIGIDWRRYVSKSWWVRAYFEGGGFGAGTDVDIDAGFVADWQFARHFALDFGYTYFYYKLTIADVTEGPFQRELISKQGLNGPRLGLGITF